MDRLMRVGILTVSDSASQGDALDRSGPVLLGLVVEAWPEVDIETAIVPDDLEQISTRLRQWCDHEGLMLVLTTGGTGFAPRDVTPEATRSILHREVPGMAEAIRIAGLRITPHAMLSRGIAGIRHHTLIVNLSGSPKAVQEQFAVIEPVIPHALELLKGSAELMQHARPGEHQRE